MPVLEHHIKEVHWIDVELEGAVEQTNVTPAIMINILDHEEENEFLSTWYVDDGEALKLSQFLEKSLSVVKEQRLDNTEHIVIGYLGESEENSWLTVMVSRNTTRWQNDNNLNRFYWVNLNFDDELVRENPGNSRLCLTPDTAKQLSQFLLEVIQNKPAYIPHIYSPPEPNDLVITELYF